MKPILLLAEGDAELRDLYRGYLTAHDYEVVVAENGLDCLQQLRQANPDLVVLDMELIWGGGDGVLCWLREDGARIDIPVIATATAGCQPNVAEDLEPPVVDFLAKPFALKALGETVCAAIARKGRLQPHRWPHATGCSEIYIG